MDEQEKDRQDAVPKQPQEEQKSTEEAQGQSAAAEPPPENVGEDAYVIPPQQWGEAEAPPETQAPEEQPTDPVQPPPAEGYAQQQPPVYDAAQEGQAPLPDFPADGAAPTDPVQPPPAEGYAQQTPPSDDPAQGGQAPLQDSPADGAAPTDPVQQPPAEGYAQQVPPSYDPAQGGQAPQEGAYPPGTAPAAPLQQPPAGQYVPPQGAQPGYNPAQGGQAPPPQGGAPPWQQPAGGASMAADQPKKKKVWVPVLIVVLAVAALVAIFFLFVRPLLGTGGAIGDTEPYTHNAQLAFTKGGEIVLWQSDGTVVKTGIKAEIAESDATGENIAYIDEKGVLYWYDVASTEKTKVADHASGVIALPFGTHVMYSDVEDATVEEILQAAVDESSDTLSYVEMMFSVLFEEQTVEEAMQVYELVTGEEYLRGSSVYLWNRESGDNEELYASGGEEDATSFTYRMSTHEKQLAYVNGGNDIILLNENGEQSILGQAPKEAEVLFAGVPDAGDLVVWRTQKGSDAVNVYAYVDGIDDKLFSVDDEYYVSCYVEYDKAQERALVYSTSLEEIYEVGTDGTLESFRVDGEKVSDIIFNNATYMAPDNFDSFYVVSYDEEDQYTLYHMDADREREKIVAIEGLYPQIRICNDQIYYIDGEDNLYTRSWNGEVGDPEKIASDAYSVLVTADGQSVWYTKGDYMDETIYRYVNGESERIDSEVAALFISPDGNTAVYVKGPTDEAGDLGTLYLYTDGGQPTQLGTDVPPYAVGTYYRGGYINPDLMSFMADVQMDDEDATFLGNLYALRGGEAEQVASDVYYEEYGIFR